MVIKEQYGEKYCEHLLEQYKLYVEMANQVSSRRVQVNRFYISLLSGLLAFLSFVVSKQSFNNDSDFILIVISLVGILLCVVWFININSYKQLNKLKFTVIHEMEKMLPFACYDREWEIDKGSEKKYVRLTYIENYVPIIMMAPYVALLSYAFVQFIK